MMPHATKRSLSDTTANLDPGSSLLDTLESKTDFDEFKHLGAFKVTGKKSKSMETLPTRTQRTHDLKTTRLACWKAQNRMVTILWALLRPEQDDQKSTIQGWGDTPWYALMLPWKLLLD